MNSRPVFLDVDGTLTPSGSNEPPMSALEAIRAAQERGHRVFLCTGRNYDMLRPLLAYGFDGAVASGGGYVFLGDRVLYDCPMTAEQAERALRLLAAGGVLRTIEAKDATYCDEGMGELLLRNSGGNSELLRWRRALEKDLGFRPMREYDGRPVYKIVFMCNDAVQLAPAAEELESEFRILVQDWEGSVCVNGELVNRKFDKGAGIRRICEALGYSPEDAIGIGDSMNDLEMIRTVGTGVCMANGSPTLKRLSRLICPAVEDDGLAWAFRKLGLTGVSEGAAEG